MDKRKQSGSQLRGQPSSDRGTSWSHDLSSRVGAGKSSAKMGSRDSFTASSTPPGTSSTHHLSRGPSGSDSHANTGISDDHSLASSAASDDLGNVDYFPAADSSDGSGPETSTLKRGSVQSGNRFIRYISKKLGRTFNKNAGFRGKAFLPNDQIERERNILQHQLFLEVLDGKLYLSPVRPRSVLDIGTGPGLWSLQIAQKFPEAYVLGIDVDPVKPPFHLPNCSFEMMDASKPWTLDHTFDFVHMRMVGELANGKHASFNEIYEHLNPGGWVEITEWIVKFQSPNHSLDKFNLWNHNFHLGLRRFGSSPSWALGWRSVMQEKGCQHVTERKYAVPVNAWPPGKRLQKQGNMMAENVQTFIEGATMPVFTGALGWTQEDVQELVASLRKEVADTNVHAFLTLMTVYCQKPREGSSVSSSAKLSTSTEAT
ncbi:hypothetical protein BJ170DRAFT_619313 [Xylariales sp. AK1849]|nr:hypothetical protein BJ170DRAFT_619313 [Xylariales sp. AK1849]